MSIDPFLDDFDDDDFDDDDGEPELTPEQVAQKMREFQAKAEDKRFAPKEYRMKVSKKRLAIVDTETDPFEDGLIVKPFTLGFYDGEHYIDFWGDDCVKQFFDYLDTLEDEYIIYAHNGGKFDFFFFLDFLDKEQTPMIMNGRLVKIFFRGQEFRDSFSIIPQRLAAYQKEEIDYSTFKRNTREKHRVKILAYQKSDCIYTFDLIRGFHEMFGDKLTIASASLPMLNSFTGFERFKTEKADERFRRFYFGGRVQCFETGILKPKFSDCFKVYDRNSMYPSVMRDELHPISSSYKVHRDITDDTDFAIIVAKNDGALPVRSVDGLDFTKRYGEFHATIHEIRAGLETKTLRIDRVKAAFSFDRKANFAEFVKQFYGFRLEAKSNNDKVRDILYKFCLNSGYGKFALNPRKFRQYLFTVNEVAEPLWSKDNPEGWKLDSTSGDIYIWTRPSTRRTGFYNVATAASITGAARANLHRNLALSKRPVYCDTDSIICEEFSGELNETELGGWKLEATGDIVGIAGKKLYAVLNQNETIKKASKGVTLTAEQILDVCRGKEIVYANPVPNFNLDGSADFVTRRINKTG